MHHGSRTQRLTATKQKEFTSHPNRPATRRAPNPDTHPHQRRLPRHIGRGCNIPVCCLLQQPGQQLSVGPVCTPRLRACTQWGVAGRAWRGNSTFQCVPTPRRARCTHTGPLEHYSHSSNQRQPCCTPQPRSQSAHPRSCPARSPAHPPAYRLRSRSTRCSRSRSSGAPSSTPSTWTRSWAALSPRTWHGG